MIAFLSQFVSVSYYDNILSLKLLFQHFAPQRNFNDKKVPVLELLKTNQHPE